MENPMASNPTQLPALATLLTNNNVPGKLSAEIPSPRYDDGTPKCQLSDNATPPAVPRAYNFNGVQFDGHSQIQQSYGEGMGKSPAAGDEKKTPVAESVKIESNLNSGGQKEQHVWNNADPTWGFGGTSRRSPAVEEFWRDVPPPLSYSPLPDLHHTAQGLEPYKCTNIGQLYTSAHPGMPYGSNLEHWRATGYPYGGGYWRRGPISYPDSGMSRDSSRDDLTSVDDRVFDFDDKFKVDRRKLEYLITGRFEPIREPASDFFQRVGEETNTTVIWPLRIKIGAKSKKDPHIRVGGTSEESVRNAKAMILYYLDTRTSRITMKMDVSYTDHSHIIGKGGNTIRRVMVETNCHVHFPDSNRSNPNEKSNQVSIAGEMDGVEHARARVRELTPLIFCFDMPIIAAFEPLPDPSDPCIKTIQDQYNIQVTFRQKQKNFHTTLVVIKGCEWEASRVKEATLLLIDRFYNKNGQQGSGMSSVANVQVSMNMEISPIHHAVVLGKANMNLRAIMQKTKTTILFPDAADPNIPSIRKGSVTITGNINNVYLTRQLLVGSLPLVMMFDLPDNVEIDDASIQKMQEELDVSISIKPKQRQANKSVMIKAQERNASGMYRARHVILGLEGDPIKADIPETYKLQSVSNFYVSSHEPSSDPTFMSFHEADAANPQHLATSSPITDTSGYTQYQNVSPYLLQNLGNLQAAGLASLAAGLGHNFALAPSGPILFGGQGQGNSPMARPCFDQIPNFNPYFSGIANSAPWMASGGGFGSILTPNHPYLQDYALRVLNHITQLQQLENQNKLAKAEMLGSINNNNYLNADSSPPLKGTSPRNSSPVHDNVGNLSNHLDKIDISDPGKFFDLNQTSTNVASSSCSSGGSSNLGILRSSVSSVNGGCTSPGATSTTNSLPTKSPTCSLSDADGKDSIPDLGQMFLDQLTDRRAPGCEKKTLQLAVQTQMDYDQKKLLATKAIQTKPTGEPRTPTPSWSGLGFSNSMPESVIRENLELNDLEGATAGSMSKRQNSTIFPSLMKVREETDEEVASSNEKPMYSPREMGQKNLDPEKAGLPSATSSNQQFFRPGWFGNSGAFEVMLNSSSVDEEDRNKILSTDDLPILFARQGLAKYSDLFIRHEVDLPTFATLTEHDLKEIGVSTFGARKKLLLLANKVKQAGSHKW